MTEGGAECSAGADFFRLFSWRKKSDLPPADPEESGSFEPTQEGPGSPGALPKEREMQPALIQKLQKKSNLAPEAIRQVLLLLEEGATIPFIARYRKERTGGADDEALRNLYDAWSYLRRLQERREEIERLVEERGHLTEKLRKELEQAESLAELEDLYRPFKEKKNTRAALALARGLQGLAELLKNEELSDQELALRARSFVRGEVKSVEEALQGAQDILAERYSDDPMERKRIRKEMERSGTLQLKAGREYEGDSAYEKYLDHAERLDRIPPHRFLAIQRGVREKKLSLKVSLELEETLRRLERLHNPRKKGGSAARVVEACVDGLKRLLLPSVEREVLGEVRERSEAQAMVVFGKNLSQLLLTPPVTGLTILGVDPGYRTGCKLTVLDPSGKLLEEGVIYPTPPRSDYEASKARVLELVDRHGVGGVAIGNGTGSRETQEFFARMNRETGRSLPYTVVSEAGASVYSASALARKEYPHLDATVRGAISIAQRLQDPMAAFVKIDPASLGVGQYQHDMDQKLLARKLKETIETLVNRVGVDVNSASWPLLSYVAGIKESLARAIVAHREAKGPFRSKAELKKVKGMGEKAFEQCAGFLRIRNGETLLDNTGVHPESYAVASQLLERCPKPEACEKDAKSLSRELGVGEETLLDILRELQKPGFDPREELPPVPFREDLPDLEDLQPGSVVSGVVRNLTDFGAFVDIGLKQDGLIHISEMANRRIRHPMEVLSLNQYLPSIRVLEVEAKKGRISLSLREVNPEKS